MRVDGVGRYELLGETIDDAAGEAFDKSAKLMGLGYPGRAGAVAAGGAGRSRRLSSCRARCCTAATSISRSPASRPPCSRRRKSWAPELEARKADLAASTQAAIVEVLVKKSLAALERSGLQRLVVAGGVGANKALRGELNAACAKRGVRVHYPELHLCTDNGAMIAMAAAMRLQAGMQEASRDYAFDVKPRWPLAELQLHG